MRVVGPAFVLENTDNFETYKKTMENYKRALVTKWAYLLEGTEKMKKKMPKLAEWMYEPMAMMLENQQASALGIIQEATMTTDLTLPVKYSLPLIRLLFPQLFALKYCSIQPLPMWSGGVGQIFWQDFLREDALGQPSVIIPDSDYAVNVENGVPKRLKMTIVSGSITTTKDILAATWSTEVAQDARGVLGLDVESELIGQCAAEIVREIDERLLFQIWTEAAAGNTDWHWTVPAGTLSDKIHYETLGHAIIDAEDLIYGERYRHADFCVGGREFVKYIRKMQDFKPEPRKMPDRGEAMPMGVELVGHIEGFWDIYLTHYPWMTNRAIVGVYPTNQIDAGMVWAPYVPLTPMPLVYAEFKPYNDPTMPGAYVNTDKWSRNISTRNGKRMIVPEYFATISLSA